MDYKIIVHGGAWDIPKEYHQDHIIGVKKAVLAGKEILSTKGTAIEACLAAVKCLEDDPTFDAGKGAFLNSKGEVELDAIIMDGSDYSLGSVSGIQNIKNPVELANLVRTNSEHCMLTAQGAVDFAIEKGMSTIPTQDLLVGRELDRYKELLTKGTINAKVFFDKPSKMGTVGAVAIDSQGRIAAATSTGGTPNKLAGRIGDSPLVGSGAYACPQGGASTTGWGESIMKVVLAKTATDYSEMGANAQEATDKAIKKLEEAVNGLAGIIFIDKDGNPSFSYNTPYMARALATADGLEYATV